MREGLNVSASERGTAIIDDQRRRDPALCAVQVVFCEHLPFGPAGRVVQENRRQGDGWRERAQV